MTLNITRLLIVLFCFLSQVLYASEAVPHESTVSANELRRDGARYVGKDVSVTGFLMVDQGMFLYPNMESFIRYDVRRSVYFAVPDYEKYEPLSGCFVTLVGTVGTHKTDRDAYLISHVKSITRTGFLYQNAKERGEADIKCEVNAIVDAM